MGYNISLLHLLKISSAVVSSLASTFSGMSFVYITCYSLLLSKEHRNRILASAFSDRCYSLLLQTYLFCNGKTNFVLEVKNQLYGWYKWIDLTDTMLIFCWAVPISVFMFTLPLPYLGVASTLPTGFVAGVIVLVMGLLIYARTPSMASTDVSSPSSIWCSTRASETTLPIERNGWHRPGFGSG